MKHSIHLFGNVVQTFYIWCMKRLAPISNNIECVASIVRMNNNVIMYDAIIEHEIIGYFVGLNTYPPTERYMEFTDREAADAFFDKLDVRVTMAERGICLN